MFHYNKHDLFRVWCLKCVPNKSRNEWQLFPSHQTKKIRKPTHGNVAFVWNSRNRCYPMLMLSVIIMLCDTEWWSAHGEMGFWCTTSSCSATNLFSQQILLNKPLIYTELRGNIVLNVEQMLFRRGRVL